MGSRILASRLLGSKILTAGAAVWIALAGAVYAEAPTPSPDSTSPQNQRSNIPEAQKAPLSGANSFTERQARERIEKHGYRGVANLKLDQQGIWRGQAEKAGRTVSVSLDYRGNVVAQ